MDKEIPYPVYVLDTSAFFLSLSFHGSMMTVSKVVDELKDLRGKARLDVLISQGLLIRDPGRDALTAVNAASSISGDLTVLSSTDVDLIALAHEVHGELCTDDFALQNTARILGIPISPLLQRKSEAKKWKLRCAGCGKYYDEMPRDSTCQICGSPIKRKNK
jgi:endoribonuclease Nob1